MTPEEIEAQKRRQLAASLPGAQVTGPVRNQDLPVAGPGSVRNGLQMTSQAAAYDNDPGAVSTTAPALPDPSKATYETQPGGGVLVTPPLNQAGEVIDPKTPDATRPVGAPYDPSIPYNDKGKQGNWYREGLANQVLNPTTRPAPQLDPNAGRLGAATTMAAPYVNPTERAQAATAYAGQIGQAQQAQAGNVGITERYNAANIGAAPVAKAGSVNNINNINAAKLETSAQDQARAQQANLSRDLELASKGGGPSAAQAMLQQNLAKQQLAQISAAAGARGAGVARVQRQAGINMEQAQSEAGMQAAQIRANEQIAARGQLAGALQGMRGTDVDVAQTGAQLNQQALLANQGANNTAANHQADLTQQASIANAGNQLDAQKSQAQLAQQAAAANAGAQNTSNLAQAGLNQQTSQFNAGQANQVATAQAGLNTGVSTTNAGSATDVSKFNAGQQDTRSALAAQLQTQVGAKNMDAINQFAVESAHLGMQGALANLEATLKSRGLDDQQIADIRGNLTAMLGQNPPQHPSALDVGLNVLGTGLGFYSAYNRGGGGGGSAIGAPGSSTGGGGGSPNGVDYSIEGND